MKRHLPFLLAMLLPAAAFAQGGPGFGALRWDYVSAGIIAPELDELGIELEGSTAVTERLVVFGGYRDLEREGSADRETLQIAVGYRWDARPSLDLMLSLGYGDNEFERQGANRDEEGVIIGGHVRGWVSQRFELNGALLLDNSVGSNTDTVIEVGGQYFEGNNWSYGGRVRIDEDDTSVFGGVRFYFGASRRGSEQR